MATGLSVAIENAANAARQSCVEEGITDQAEIDRRVHAASERAAALYNTTLEAPPPPSAQS